MTHLFIVVEIINTVKESSFVFVFFFFFLSKGVKIYSLEKEFKRTDLNRGLNIALMLFLISESFNGNNVEEYKYLFIIYLRVLVSIFLQEWKNNKTNSKMLLIKAVSAETFILIYFLKQSRDNNSNKFNLNFLADTYGLQHEKWHLFCNNVGVARSMPSCSNHISLKSISSNSCQKRWHLHHFLKRKVRLSSHQTVTFWRCGKFLERNLDFQLSRFKNSAW